MIYIGWVMLSLFAFFLLLLTVLGKVLSFQNPLSEIGVMCGGVVWRAGVMLLTVKN